MTDRKWKTWEVIGLLVTLALGAVRLDLMGYASRVPEASEVASVEIGRYQGDSAPITDPDAIAQTIALHQYFVDTRGARENLTPADTDNAWWNTDICIRYTLKDGSTFARTYTFLCSASTAADPDSAYSRANALVHTQSVRLAMYAPGFALTDQSVLDCTLDGPIAYDEQLGDWRYSSLTLSSREAAALYNDCILPDLLDGALGASDGIYNYPESSAEPTAETSEPAYMPEEERLQQTSVSFLLLGSDGAKHSYYYDLSSDAVRTVAYLQELGYLPK